MSTLEENVPLEAPPPPPSPPHGDDQESFHEDKASSSLSAPVNAVGAKDEETEESPEDNKEDEEEAGRRVHAQENDDAGEGEDEGEREGNEDEEELGEEVEEVEEVEEEEEEEDEEDEEEGEMEEEFFPESPTASATATADPLVGSVSPQQTFIVDGKPYPATRFIRNKAFYKVLGKAKQNSKAAFTACQMVNPHNVADCWFLHFSNRGILVGDRYIRVHMFVENAGKQALLKQPGNSLQMSICREDHPEGPACCDKLHLLPDIIFVGVPGLRTAYFTAEVHHNLGYKNTAAQPWEEQCGSWCRASFSHVVTTCKYLHYKYDNSYTEKPKPPHRPTPLIPAHTPRRPPQEHDLPRGRGRGRGRGGRGASRGGRGGGRGADRGGRGRGARGGGGRERGRGRGRGRGGPRQPNLVNAEDIAAALPGMQEAAQGVAAARAAAKATRHTKAKDFVIVKDDPILSTLKVSSDSLSSLFFALVALAVLLVAFMVGKSWINASLNSSE